MKIEKKSVVIKNNDQFIQLMNEAIAHYENKQKYSWEEKRIMNAYKQSLFSYINKHYDIEGNE